MSPLYFICTKKKGEQEKSVWKKYKKFAQSILFFTNYRPGWRTNSINVCIQLLNFTAVVLVYNNIKEKNLRTWILRHQGSNTFLKIVSVNKKYCRIPIRHFFSQSRRLLTKNFKSAETVNEKFRCLWIWGQGAIKLGYYARYLFPLSPFHKPGTRRAGLNREVPKSPSA